MKSKIYIFCLWSTVSIFSQTTIGFVGKNMLQIGDFVPFPSLILLLDADFEGTNDETTED